jgi:pre-mRNA-splicing factor SYF1
MDQKLITRTRRAFDRALCALPVTQHYRIWELYLKFIKQAGVQETCIKVYRRYLKLEPSSREEYIEYLLSIKQYDEAASQLAMVVNDGEFTSKKVI